LLGFKSELGLRPIFHHWQERTDGWVLRLPRATRRDGLRWPGHLAIYQALGISIQPGVPKTFQPQPRNPENRPSAVLHSESRNPK
jgi:hypothetical protein